MNNLIITEINCRLKELEFSLECIERNTNPANESDVNLRQMNLRQCIKGFINDLYALKEYLNKSCGRTMKEDKIEPFFNNTISGVGFLKELCNGLKHHYKSMSVLYDAEYPPNSPYVSGVTETIKNCLDNGIPISVNVGINSSRSETVDYVSDNQHLYPKCKEGFEKIKIFVNTEILPNFLL